MKKTSGGLLSTILLGSSILIFLFSIFAFFGPLITRPAGYSSGPNPNMFSYMFGIAGANLGADVVRIPGITAIFVFQVLNTVLLGFLIYTIISKQHSTVLSFVLLGIVCLFALIALIISFNSLKLYIDAKQASYVALEYKLGAGPIIYSVLNLVGIGAALAGMILRRFGH